MIETIHLPILLKAIDFVFDEGRKILEERRERRKMDANSPQSAAQEAAEEIPLPDVEKGNEIKQDLLTSKIDEILWQNHEWEIGSLVRRLEVQTKSYYILKEQYAQWGSALVPPVILLQMEQKENSIIETRNELESVLSKVYKKDINPIK
jgi:hypothetical protein